MIVGDFTYLVLFCFILVFLGTAGESFTINNQSLEVDKQYILIVEVTVEGREDVGEAGMTFVTNLAPYGGHCEASPSSGTSDCAFVLLRSKIY